MSPDTSKSKTPALRFWMHKTKTGTIKYKKKKRQLKMKAVQYFVMRAYELELGSGFSWRYVLKLSEQMYRFFLEKERLAQPDLEEFTRVDAEDKLVRLWYEFIVGIQQAWTAAEQIGHYLPYVGAVLSLGKIVIDYLVKLFYDTVYSKMEEARKRYEE